MMHAPDLHSLPLPVSMVRSLDWSKALLLGCLCGCADATGPERVSPEAERFAGVVSDAILGTSATPSRGATMHQAGVAPLAWISLPSGADPAALAATIRNVRTNEALSADVIDGGFDPVAIAATSGDTVEIALTLDAETTSLMRARVPERRRPRVVRTSPTRGRLDVAVNSSIVVIFSEPIADSTADTRHFHLFENGRTIPGSVARLPNSPVGITFTPAAPLAPGGAYRLVLDDHIVDLAGDTLEAFLPVEFSTATTQSAGAPAESPAEPPPGPPAGPPADSPLEVPAEAPVPPSWTGNVWSHMTEINYGLAPEGGTRLLPIYADVAPAAGQIGVTITGDQAFTIRSETCSNGWDTAELIQCRVTVGFTPSGAPRDYAGTLVIADASGPRISLPLWGTTVPVTLSVTASGSLPSGLMAGLVSDPVIVTVSNPSSLSSEMLRTVHRDCTFWMESGCTVITPLHSGMTVTDDTCDGQALASGASCTLRVAFAPSALQYYTAMLEFDRASTATFSVQGYGTGLEAGPHQYDFPVISVGMTATGATTVTNLGDLATGTIAVELDSGPFSLVSSADGCSGRSLQPGASCSVVFTYSPIEAGRHSASLWFRTSPGGPYIALVTGTAQ